MRFTVIENSDYSKKTAYKVARTVYAETGAVSLRAVEALTSMIYNISKKYSRDIENIISDSNIFECVSVSSPHHDNMNIDANNRGLQMCVRVAERMLHNMLPDYCCGATRFHHDDNIPEWAMSRGYIADIDGLLFYS